LQLPVSLAGNCPDEDDEDDDEDDELGAPGMQQPESSPQSSAVPCVPAGQKRKLHCPPLFSQAVRTGVSSPRRTTKSGSPPQPSLWQAEAKTSMPVATIDRSCLPMAWPREQTTCQRARARVIS